MGWGGTRHATQLQSTVITFEEEKDLNPTPPCISMPPKGFLFAFSDGFD